jgi:imidazolonepropionase-like amidohydrolase
VYSQLTANSSSPSFLLKSALLLPALMLLLSSSSQAQETFPVNGVREKNSKLFAFTHCVLHPDANSTIKDAILLIRDGRVEQAGAKVKIPPGTIVRDLKGMHIYPAFIDPFATYGVAVQKTVEKSAPGSPNAAPAGPSGKGTANWNPAIRSEMDAGELFAPDASAAKEFRSNGFGTVASFHNDGIARGTSVVVTLQEGRENELVIKESAAAHYSFNKGTSTADYPSSLMGSIALLRQTYLDADWYKNQKVRTEANRSLEAWNRSQSLPQIFEVKDKQSLLRADRVGDEAGFQYIIKGAGDEYQLLDAVKATKAALILPLELPKAYDVENPYEALSVSISQLKHWELAPYNAARVAAAGIPFAFTLYDLKEKSAFRKNLQSILDKGLTPAKALEALTTAPARMLRIEQEVGTLQPGKLANFIISSGELFGKESTWHENWVKGQRYVLQPIPDLDMRGTYSLQLGATGAYKLEVKGKVTQPEATVIVRDTVKLPTTLTVENGQVTLLFSPAPDSSQRFIRLTGYQKDEKWQGRGQLPNGNWISWLATKTAAPKPEQTISPDTATGAIKDSPPGAVWYPFQAYGFEKLPTAGTTLIKNATIWTNEAEGILQQTDVLLQDGKIAAIGKNLKPGKGKSKSKTDPQVIDGTGKHLTAGIIDEHSHIAIQAGVNEGGQAVTSEVRIGDVVDPADINIYRQLAGGVTASQLLHGSANPIGGQSALIKLRWGSTPEEMKIAGADGFIKFALGENVKQSNWGPGTRFPQTRMGVEQVFYDSFLRAREYAAANKRIKGLSKKKREAETAPRKDLELDALQEIYDRKRFITCHSYVQSEINMLLHVADSMRFKVNTFTHILEGYKVADKMKKHGAAASTFSDWWAYKFEVNDAIPYNGAMMHEDGLLVGFNSDDAEMGRRLNQEAGKALKYGGVSETDALKFVTLNPAKMLHLDKKMGSIKVGKDADMVLWSAHPLSIYAEAEKTFVDGRCLYDKSTETQRQAAVQAERARLIQKMIAYKRSGGQTQPAKPEKKKEYHCDDLENQDEAY